MMVGPQEEQAMQTGTPGGAWRRLASLVIAAASMFTAGCAGLAPAPDYAAIVAAPDRAASDRPIDARRRQPQLLAFTGVRPGMRVLDLDAAAGYTTELLARAVGASGVVYAQDSRGQMERARVRMDERMKTPAMANVVRVVREYDDPVPPGIAPLDLATFFFGYHDLAFTDVDRAAMNRKLFDAMKPGGVVVVADHSARAGAGTSVAKSLHRIEESVIRREFEAAGFRLVAEGGFLRNPDDPRDTLVFRSPVPVDEFVLKFEKPR
jgi:predicted methyltransferase